MKPNHLLTLSITLGLTLAGHALGDTNPIVNGELDQWKDGKPIGWNVLEGGFAAEDKLMLASGTAAARMHPLRDQASVHPNCILEQVVELRPNSTYRLSFWTAKDTYGDVRAYVVAQDGSGIVLEFISGWADFIPWTEINQTFQTNDATQYALRLVQYGPPADDVWFDRVKLERIPEPGEPDALAAGPNGVALFAQSAMIPFDEAGPDATAIPTDRYSIRKAANEYEPCLVALQAGRDLSNVDLRLTGDLTGADGAVIGKNDVVIRSYEEGVLPLTRPRDVAAGRAVAWWLTMRPTPDLAPGRYTGTLEIVEDGRVIDDAQLVVEQLDLMLPQPDAAFWVYHAEYYFPDEHLTPELKKAYYRDMVEHGMNTVTIYGSPNVDGQRIDFSKNYILSEERYPQVHAWGFDHSVPAILEAGLCAQGQPLILLTHKQEGPGMDKDYTEPIMRQFVEQWQKRGWPEPWFYVHDEPSNAERIAKAKPVLERIRSWGMPLTLTTAGLDIPALGGLYDVWIQAESEINRETRAAAREHDATLWTYNCTVPYTNAPFNRAFYGFWAYRSGLKGFARWAYHDNTSAIVDEEGNIHGTTGPRLSQVFSSADGPVPTAAWEAAREGIDDYRLMMIYDQTLQEAEHELATLEENYRALLSSEEIDTLTRLLKREHTKKADDEQPIEWDAASTQQQRGEAAFRDAKQLAHVVQMAEYARTKVFESIPADAMGHRAALPYSSANATLYPPLGIGDQRTVTETKRRTLIGYMQRLRAALDAPRD